MLTPTTILDERYRVDRKIGEGGFGAVYAGFHLRLGVPVAIKVLRFDVAQRADRLATFLDEGRLLTRLHHPHIVAALDLGVFEGGGITPLPYLVMEWVDGVTLAAHLASRGRALSIAEAWLLVEPLLEALAHAHAQRVVHRDLTPSNVMVIATASGALVPRVIDFGVAKLVAPDDVAGEGWTSTATPFAFTPAYAAEGDLEAGLRACSGQHADLGQVCDGTGLDGAWSIAAEKSGSLAAAICQLGALAAGADGPAQTRYASFGRLLGIAAQLANDLRALAPGARGKTDLLFRRPTLPLVFASCAGTDGVGAQPNPWSSGAAHFTWAVADTHRRRAMDLIPALTADDRCRVALASLLHVL